VHNKLTRIIQSLYYALLH